MKKKNSTFLVDVRARTPSAIEMRATQKEGLGTYSDYDYDRSWVLIADFE